MTAEHVSALPVERVSNLQLTNLAELAEHPPPRVLCPKSPSPPR